MELLTEVLRARIPLIGKSERDPWIYCKFFTPDGGWTWWVCEYDGEDLFFGCAEGLMRELGYFSLRELMQVRGRLGLRVERDRFFQPVRLSELIG